MDRAAGPHLLRHFRITLRFRIGAGWSTPSIYKSQSINGSTSVSKVWGKHTIVAGYQYDYLYLIASHGSCCSADTPELDRALPGNAFADYLLGYTDTEFKKLPNPDTRDEVRPIWR